MKIIVDTREQTPWEFKGISQVIEKLDTGDYSLQGYENKISIERKSVEDIIGTLTSGRKRFENEVMRAKDYHFFCVIIEGTFQDIKDHIIKQYAINKKMGRKVSPWMIQSQTSGVINTLIHWQVRFPWFKVILCKDRKEAEQVCVECFIAWEKYLKRGCIILN